MTDPTNVGATKMATLLFGSKPIEQFKQDTGLTVRQIWEIASTKTQCNQTVGKLKDDTKCWICDFPIDLDAKAGHALAPECEHVLPIVQARFFLSLYNSDMKDNLSEKARKGLLLEYAWAHSVCNQEKKQISFLKSDVEKNFKIYGDNIEETLTKIYKSDRLQSEKLKELIDNYGYKDWKIARIKAISKRIQDIIDYLKNDRPDGIFNLLLLAGNIDSMAPENLNKEFAKLIEDGTTRKFVEYVKEDVGVLLETSNKLILRIAKNLYDFIQTKMKRKESFYRELFNVVELDEDSIVQSIYTTSKEQNYHYNTIYDKIYDEEPSIAEPTTIEFIHVLIYGYLYNKTLTLKDTNVGIDKVFLGNIKYMFYNSLHVIILKEKLPIIIINYLINILNEYYPSLKKEIDYFLQENKEKNFNTTRKRKRSHSNISNNSNNSNKTNKRKKSNSNNNNNNNNSSINKNTLDKIASKISLALRKKLKSKKT